MRSKEPFNPSPIDPPSPFFLPLEFILSLPSTLTRLTFLRSFSDVSLGPECFAYCRSLPIWQFHEWASFKREFTDCVNRLGENLSFETLLNRTKIWRKRDGECSLRRFLQFMNQLATVMFRACLYKIIYVYIVNRNLNFKTSRTLRVDDRLKIIHSVWYKKD